MSMNRAGTRVAALAAALTVATLLGGCFEEEKRPLIQYNHEDYQGKQDTQLSSDTVDRLRSRAAAQAQPF